MKKVGYLEGTNSTYLTRLALRGVDTLPLGNGADNHGKYIGFIDRSDAIDLVITYFHKIVPLTGQNTSPQSMLQACQLNKIPVLIIAPKELHDKAKEWLLQLGEADTMLIHKAINNTERVVKTEFSQKILDMEEKGAPLDEILPLISGENVRDAYNTGEISNALFTAGQVVGLVHDIPSVKEIIDGIISEASVIVQRLQDITGTR